jgi:hypothetical protein
MFAMIVVSWSVFLGADEDTRESETPDPRTHDFGTIREGDRPSCSFRFVNPADVPVTALSLRIPCGCAKTTFRETVLGPGEETAFEIRLESAGLRGKVSKSVYLVTDSKETPLVRYVMKADVLPKPEPVCHAPSEINLGPVAPGMEIGFSFEIENRGGLELSVRTESVSPGIRTGENSSVTVAPGGKAKFEMVFVAPFYEGKTKANIVLKTNDVRKPTLWIPVLADVKKDAKGSGSRLESP